MYIVFNSYMQYFIYKKNALRNQDQIKILYINIYILNILDYLKLHFLKYICYK